MNQVPGSVRQLCRMAAIIGQVPLGELMGRIRRQDVARARFALVHQLHHTLRTRASLPQIGRWIDRDHTSVMHALRRAEELSLTDPDFAAMLDLLRHHARAIRAAEIRLSRRTARQALQDATARLLRDQETARRLVAMQASSQVAH
jgi:hypothetical protein